MPKIQAENKCPKYVPKFHPKNSSPKCIPKFHAQNLLPDIHFKNLCQKYILIPKIFTIIKKYFRKMYVERFTKFSNKKRIFSLQISKQLWRRKVYVSSPKVRFQKWN